MSRQSCPVAAATIIDEYMLEAFWIWILFFGLYKVSRLLHARRPIDGLSHFQQQRWRMRFRAHNLHVATFWTVSRRVYTHKLWRISIFAPGFSVMRWNVRKLWERVSSTFINRRCSSELMTLNIYVAIVLGLSWPVYTHTLLWISTWLLSSTEKWRLLRSWRLRIYSLCT